MKAPDLQALQEQCDGFNARYPVGQRVTVRKDNGEGVSTTTRSRAEVLGGHSAVIWLEGISGCYLLNRVTPMTDGDDAVAYYEISDDGVMRALPTWQRNNLGTFLRLQLEATNVITEEEVERWTDEQVKEADCWAFSVHLSASDNDDIKVPPRPPFIPIGDPLAGRNPVTGEPLI